MSGLIPLTLQAKATDRFPRSSTEYEYALWRHVGCVRTQPKWLKNTTALVPPGAMPLQAIRVHAFRLRMGLGSLRKSALGLVMKSWRHLVARTAPRPCPAPRALTHTRPSSLTSYMWKSRRGVAVLQVKTIILLEQSRKPPILAPTASDACVCVCTTAPEWAWGVMSYPCTAPSSPRVCMPQCPLARPHSSPGEGSTSAPDHYR